jgi:hypothetical protein
MENEATTKTPIPTRSGFRNFALCTLIFALSRWPFYDEDSYKSCFDNNIAQFVIPAKAGIQNCGKQCSSVSISV